jgi:hypothetical protein
MRGPDQSLQDWEMCSEWLPDRTGRNLRFARANIVAHPDRQVHGPTTATLRSLRSDRATPIGALRKSLGVTCLKRYRAYARA